MKCKCGKEFCYKCGGIYGKCECGKLGSLIYPYLVRKAEEQRKLMMEKIRLKQKQRAASKKKKEPKNQRQIPSY